MQWAILAEFSSKDIKQDLCRLLVKGKDDDDEKFEMKVGVMRKRLSFFFPPRSDRDESPLAEMQMEHAKCALAAGIKFLQVRQSRTKDDDHLPSLSVTLRHQSIQSIPFENASA